MVINSISANELTIDIPITIRIFSYKDLKHNGNSI